MTDNKKDCTTGACPVEKKDGHNNMVKSTELPLLGNPYPPKDVIQDDSPGSLELAVRSIRTSLQPYLSPISSAYARTNDIFSTGLAHSQSAIANLRENQSSMARVLVIAGSGVLAWTLVRRRNIFKKLFYTSIAAAGTASFCFPNEAKEKADILWLIAKNKLPSLMQEQYGNLTSAKPDEAKEVKSSETKTEGS